MEGNGYRLRSAHGETIDPRQPLPVDSSEARSIDTATPTITYNGKAAAGAITINSVLAKPIISIEGDQIASFWGNLQNKVFTAYNQLDNNSKNKDHWLTALVKTATSATFKIYDPNHNLENMFESATGTVKRFVAKATDKNDISIYGWIQTISPSSNVYTFNVYNAKQSESAQSWVGDVTDFDATNVVKVEIYRFNSSLNFNTGTTLTEEVMCPKEFSKSWDRLMEFANSLTNGQYFVDYMRGRIIGKKADTTVSETVTYNIWTATVGGSGFFFRKSTTKILSANNTTAHIPIFRMTGSVRVLKLYAVPLVALGVNHTAAGFRLNDQTSQIPITSNAGTTLSAAPVGSLIIKTGLAAAAVTFKSSDAGAFLEPTTLETVIPEEFIVVQKTGGVETDIEYSYTTTDTPTTGQLQFFCEHQALSADGNVTPL